MTRRHDDRPAGSTVAGLTLERSFSKGLFWVSEWVGKREALGSGSHTHGVPAFPAEFGIQNAFAQKATLFDQKAWCSARRRDGQGPGGVGRSASGFCNGLSGFSDGRTMGCGSGNSTGTVTERFPAACQRLQAEAFGVLYEVSVAVYVYATPLFVGPRLARAFVIQVGFARRGSGTPFRYESGCLAENGGAALAKTRADRGRPATAILRKRQPPESPPPGPGGRFPGSRRPGRLRPGRQSGSRPPSGAQHSAEPRDAATSCRSSPGR